MPDSLAAIAARADGFLLANSPRHEVRLRPAGPDAVIQTMTALADCL
jgi:phosphoglycolate phosphatase-like HAD superfamily hydrolase